LAPFLHGLLAHSSTSLQVDESWPGKPNQSANGYTRSLCVLDVAEDDTYDHRLSNATIDSLRLASQQHRPFAIFAGKRAFPQ
jgi:environmental stress-induced protein Ves